MQKEIIVCIFIIVLITVGNVVTQNYTVESVESISNQLSDLKSDIFEEEDNIERDSVKDKIKQIENNWESRHDKLAYYIEHDELEKVETNLTSLRSFIEANEDSEAVSELDKSVFVLKHIEDKYAFNLQNIF